jgi:hypothetical protein
MTDEPHDGGHFTCNKDDEAHSFQLEIDFHIDEADADQMIPSAAAIHTHVHNVPTEIVVQTLIIMAHRMMSDHLAHGVFGGAPNHIIAHSMASAAAGAYLTNMVNNVPDENSLEQVSIPDDASSLLEGD